MTVYSTADEVAKYFLSKSSMSNKKLQKIVYYAYSWTLTLLNNSEDSLDNKLFSDRIEGWVHGPVCPTLYHKYKVHGWDNIPTYEEEIPSFPEDVVSVLDQVWKIYGKYSGNELEDISHQEHPWKESRQGLSAFESSNTFLKDQTIYSHYNMVAIKD